MEPIKELEKVVPPIVYYGVLIVVVLFVTVVAFFKGVDTLKKSGTFTQLIEFAKRKKAVIKYGFMGVMTGFTAYSYFYFKYPVLIMFFSLFLFITTIFLIMDLSAFVIEIFKKQTDNTSNHIKMTADLASSVKELANDKKAE